MSANAAAIPAEDITTDADDVTEAAVFRDGEREFQESTSAFRGLLFATLFSISIWAIIGLAVWGIVTLVNR